MRSDELVKRRFLREIGRSVEQIERMDDGFMKNKLMHQTTMDILKIILTIEELEQEK